MPPPPSMALVHLSAVASENGELDGRPPTFNDFKFPPSPTTNNAVSPTACGASKLASFWRPLMRTFASSGMLQNGMTGSLRVAVPSSTRSVPISLSVIRTMAVSTREVAPLYLLACVRARRLSTAASATRSAAIVPEASACDEGGSVVSLYRMPASKTEPCTIPRAVSLLVAAPSSSPTSSRGDGHSESPYVSNATRPFKPS